MHNLHSFQSDSQSCQDAAGKENKFANIFFFPYFSLFCKGKYCFFVPICLGKNVFSVSVDKQKSLSFQRCSMLSSSSRRPREILFAPVYVSFDHHLMLLQFSKLCCNKMRLNIILNLNTLPAKMLLVFLTNALDMINVQSTCLTDRQICRKLFASNAMYLSSYHPGFGRN